MVHTRLKVIRKAIEMIDKGNTAMTIFALKNLCGWSDKHEVVTPGDNKFTLAYTLND